MRRSLVRSPIRFVFCPCPFLSLHDWSTRAGAAIVDEARAAHTAIRTLFLQNLLDTREADKREFVFLSQLHSQATISWVAFGWPDGAFFAAHMD